MRKNDMRPIAILGLLMLLFASCDRQEEVNNGEYAELTFKIATSSINSRGNVSDNPYNTSQWTDAEKLIDGRSIYTLSVYLVDSDQQIADYKILPLTNATEAIVTFDDIKKGDYTLYAVANNSAQSIGNKTYNSGLLESWKDSNLNALINNKIGISSDKVSAKDVIQPLSLVKNVTLHAGKNYETGELKRTYARLRIVVENNSTVLPLQIKSLTFNENFTQTQAYVFDDGTDRKYFGTLGAPISTSSLALHPFTPNTDNGILEIEPYNSAVVFDGYILESKLTGDDVYQYTLDLLYDGVVVDPEEPEEPEEPEGPTEKSWVTMTSLNDITEGEYSLRFYYYNNDIVPFITVNPSNNTAVMENTDVIASTDVADKYLWEFILAGNGAYYIRNKATGLYMQDPPPSGTALSLASTPAEYTIATIDSNGTTYFLLRRNSRQLYFYSYSIVSGYTAQWNYSNNYISMFRLDNVSRARSNSRASTKAVQGGTITFNDPITLKTIDPVTQQASTTKEIKRNDFIDVHVTVSFNSVAGEIEYVVKDWTTVNGDVEFD